MTKPQPFPHRYCVSIENRELVAPPRAPVAIGAPVQFGGSDRVWGPEELLIGATLECLWTTFEAYARQDRLAIHAFRGSAIGTLDRGPKVPVFTGIELVADVTVDATDVERTRKLLETAETHCIVANALRVPVTLHADVHPLPVG